MWSKPDLALLFQIYYCSENSVCGRDEAGYTCDITEYIDQELLRHPLTESEGSRFFERYFVFTKVAKPHGVFIDYRNHYLGKNAC